MTRAPSALVTDGEERAALAACRGLRDAGYDVTIAYHERLAPAAWSRACTSRVRLPAPRTSPAAYMDALAAAAKTHGWDVVLPGSEASLRAISEHRNELPPSVRLGMPTHDVVLAALDKVLLQTTAADAGLAPPPGIVCATPAEAMQAGRQLGYPLILKPKSSFRAGTGALEQVSAQIVSGPDELDEALLRVHLPVTAQRFLSARLISCAGVRTSDGIAGFTVVRYTRTWPPEAGNAAFATTITPPADLRGRVSDLLARLGWRGIFELELLDTDDGTLAAIDLNPRVFGWMSLAIAAGANLPAIWCDGLLGRGSEWPDAIPGRRYRWEEGEAKYLLRKLRHGQIRGLSTLGPHRDVVHACFQLRDPAPLLAQALRATHDATANARSRRRPIS